MKFEDDLECTATISEILPYGMHVEVDGIVGFVDQAKHPSWWSEAPPPVKGDEIQVVVVDSSRIPPRLSALSDDSSIAKERRSRKQ